MLAQPASVSFVTLILIALMVIDRYIYLCTNIKGTTVQFAKFVAVNSQCTDGDSPVMLHIININLLLSSE